MISLSSCILSLSLCLDYAKKIDVPKNTGKAENKNNTYQQIFEEKINLYQFTCSKLICIVRKYLSRKDHNV